MGPDSQRTLIDHLSLSVLLPVIRFSYGFALAALLSKYLPVNAYGEWSLFISVMGLILVFSSLNLMYSSQVVLTGKRFEEQREDMFSVGGFKLLFTIAVYSAVSAYLYFWEVIEPPLILLLLLALVFRTVNDLVFGFLRALLRLKRQVLFLFVESALIIGAVATSCYLLSGGLRGAIYAFIGAETLATIIGLYLMKQYLGWFTWKWQVVRKYLRIGLPLIPFSFSDLIVNALVPLLLKIYEGSHEVAFYSIAQKVALVATVPNAVINNVYAQYLKKSFLADGGAGVRRTFLAFLGIYLAMAVPVGGILYLFGEDIIRLISTEEYVHSYELMLHLVVVNVLIMITAMLTTIFAVYDRTKTVGLIWIGVLVFFVILNQILIPRYSTLGTAYALQISFGLGLVLVVAAAIRLRNSVKTPDGPNTVNPD